MNPGVSHEDVNTKRIDFMGIRRQFSSNIHVLLHVYVVENRKRLKDINRNININVYQHILPCKML